MIYYYIGAAVIIIILILIGAYRGIIRTLFNLIGLALNAFLSYHIAGPLAQGMYDSFFKQAVITKIQEVIMTTKELLYVEDALGHEQYFQTQCKETANQIQDPELRNFASQLGEKHSELFKGFYNLL